MITHSTLGLWHLYQDIPQKRSSWPSLRALNVALDALPYVGRMLTDIAAIPAISPLLLAYLLVELLLSFLPAVLLAYNASLLDIVQTAVDSRTVDPHVLSHVVAGLVLTSAASRLLHRLKDRIAAPLHLRIKNYYSVHIFGAMARLDVPTFDDPAVQRQLEQSFPKHSSTTIAFRALSAASTLVSNIIQLLSQLSVLVAVLHNHPDAPLLALLCCTTVYFQLNKSHHLYLDDGVWLATTTNKDYIKSEGLKRAVTDPIHRKEIVAGGIAPFLLAQYRQAVARISDHAGSFYDALAAERRSREPSFGILFEEFLHALPQIVFALRAVNQPTSIPLSVASLNLITTTTQSFTYTAFALIEGTGSISERLSAVRQLYQVATIPNRVKVHSPKKDSDADEATVGTPFPEDDKTIACGISVEFRNVSFVYPGSDAYALRNINFKLERGQLCVIVGNNGSGKSTILKLISRLYDPTEGTILIDGVDIKTLRLVDLRRAISVLFQDYTHFPLCIHDNIALGDPAHADDRAKVERAAQLGGADAFIERLPEKYDTYLERPVQDYYSALPEGTRDPADDRPVDFTALRAAAGLAQASADGAGGGVGNRGLSGGQMQRIALSRTFMRSVVSDESVGLLLFDEPSASLDPTAEHDLFERLRTLRGNKTMVFSSHRFGNLTRHADRILYMDDSHIVEEGTHDELIAHGGEYARIWMLQARAFL